MTSLSTLSDFGPACGLGSCAQGSRMACACHKAEYRQGERRDMLILSRRADNYILGSLEARGRSSVTTRILRHFAGTDQIFSGLDSHDTKIGRRNFTFQFDRICVFDSDAALYCFRHSCNGPDDDIFMPPFFLTPLGGPATALSLYKAIRRIKQKQSRSWVFGRLRLF